MHVTSCSVISYSMHSTETGRKIWAIVCCSEKGWQAGSHGGIILSCGERLAHNVTVLCVAVSKVGKLVVTEESFYHVVIVLLIM